MASMLVFINTYLEYKPYFHAGGNFSMCRSAALTLLQKEKGRKNASIYVVFDFLEYWSLLPWNTRLYDCSSLNMLTFKLVLSSVIQM